MTNIICNHKTNTALPASQTLQQDEDIAMARQAARKASELNNAYHQLLHRNLERVDRSVAMRFSTLISELASATDITYENFKSVTYENLKNIS